MRFFREILLKNWGLKLTAIFLGFFLWLFVRGDRNVERIMTVPLEIRIPRNMEITNERPSFVEITVRGTPLNIGWSLSGQPAYTIDLQTAGEGTHVVPLSPGNVRIPPASGIEVIRVSPPRITLVLEETIAKEVPVLAPPLRGEPAEGYDVYKVTYWPTRVRVTGPRSHVDALNRVVPAPVSVTGLNQPLRTFSNLMVEDHSLRLNPAGPVEVNIMIGVHRELKTVSGIPITVEAAGFRVSPSTLSVQVLVPITLKDKLSARNFAAAVSTEGFTPDQREMQLKPEVQLIDSPDPNVSIEKVRPEQVTVRRTGQD